MYSRQALRDLRKREEITSPDASPKTLADLPPDTPMDENLELGFYDEELGRFISPKLWHQRHPYELINASERPE